MVPLPLPLGKAMGWSEPGVSWALGEGDERMGVSKDLFLWSRVVPLYFPVPFPLLRMQELEGGT